MRLLFLGFRFRLTRPLWCAGWDHGNRLWYRWRLRHERFPFNVPPFLTCRETEEWERILAEGPPRWVSDLAPAEEATAAWPNDSGAGVETT